VLWYLNYLYGLAGNLDETCTYLCGNSLGLMPKRSKQRVMEELDAWGKRYLKKIRPEKLSL
jgi:kynureninase